MTEITYSESCERETAFRSLEAAIAYFDPFLAGRTWVRLHMVIGEIDYWFGRR